MTDPRWSAIDEAEALARKAHEGQTDKSGAPYIHHVERVALRVQQAGAPAQALTVAWLHDIVEDTDTTIDDLAERFDEEVVAAVDALSRRPGEGDAYFVRVAANPLAVWVKRAHLADNADPVRLERLPEESHLRLLQKYRHVAAMLDRVVHGVGADAGS